MPIKLTSVYIGLSVLAISATVVQYNPVFAGEGEVSTIDQKSIDDLCVIENRRYTNAACQIRPRLSAFEPNYAIWQSTEDDDNALEVHYSFRYALTRPHCMQGGDIIYSYSVEETIKCIKNYERRISMFFAYTGEFDFYAGTRNSDPVVNRMNNPGLYLRKHYPGEFRWVEISLEHRSNGQTTDVNKTENGILKTQTAYDSDDNEFFDGLSRSANYFKLQTKYRRPQSRTIFYASVKAYFDEDSEVNWGPDAKDDPSYEDYDRFRFIASQGWDCFGKACEASVEWVVGDEGFDTDSYDIDFMFPIQWKFLGGVTLPWYIRYHNGPMNTLSNYTLDQETIGIGFKLKP